MKRYSDKAFPPYKHIPGRTPHPERDPRGHHFQAPATPAPAPASGDWDWDWRDHPDYLYGIDLFNAGYFWEAHAAWESLWLVAPEASPIRDLLRALIQLAAGSLKRSMGNDGGADKLFRAALGRIGSVASESESQTCLGLDLRELAERAKSSKGLSFRIDLEH